MTPSRTFQVLCVTAILGSLLLGVLAISQWPYGQSLPRLINDLQSSIARYWATRNAAEHDESFARASHAIISLGQLEARAAPAVPALNEVLNGPEMCYRNGDRSIRTEAANTLARIGPESVDPLIESLKNPDGQVRWLAARALGDIAAKHPGKAEAAIDPLAEATKDTHQYVRMFAIGALGRFGPAARRAIPALNQALEDNDQQVRDFARIAIQQIDQDASVHSGVK